MSLDVYSHVIVPDEVDPKMLGALLSGEVAAKRRVRDAPVIAQPHFLNGKTPHLRGFPVADL
jgi:hypothetical protein